MITKGSTKQTKERNVIAPHHAPRVKPLHGAIVRNADLAGVDRGYLAKGGPGAGREAALERVREFGSAKVLMPALLLPTRVKGG